MAAAKKDAHEATAEKIVAKLPKAVRDDAEVVAGAGSYTRVKVGDRTVASVRSKNCRVTFVHDGSAAQAEALAKVVADAASSKGPAASKEEKPAD